MSHIILVPLDGSTFAEAALPLAVTLARRVSARLHFLTVDEPLIAIPEIDPTVRTARPWAPDYLEDVQRRVWEQTGVAAEVTFTRGPVVSAINEQAREMGAELVVMSTHGRGRIARAWLGSVADALIRESERPVLLARPSEEGAAPDLGSEVELAHALIPLDGSVLAEQVLEPALTIGRAFETRYTLMRLVRYPREVVSSYLPDTTETVEALLEQGRTSAEAYLTDATARLRESGVEADSHVDVVDAVGRGILEKAEELDVDWIALASHGHGGLTRAFLGSVADKVVRGASRPVLVVRAREPSSGP